MSTFIPPKPNTKNGRLDWINTIVMLHNLRCGCDHALQHTVDEIYQQEPTLKLPKCHGGDDHTVAEDAFGPGDLEALFDGDFGEENAADPTSTG